MQLASLSSVARHLWSHYSTHVLRIYMVHQQTHVRYYIRIREQLTCSAHISCRSTHVFSAHVLSTHVRYYIFEYVNNSRVRHIYLVAVLTHSVLTYSVLYAQIIFCTHVLSIYVLDRQTHVISAISQSVISNASSVVAVLSQTHANSTNHHGNLMRSVHLASWPFSSASSVVAATTTQQQVGSRACS